MKLKLLLLILLIIITLGTFNAHSKIYKVGEKLTNNQVNIDNNLIINLTEGEWVVARRDELHWGWLTQFLFGFARVENGELMEIIEIYDANMGASYQSYLDEAVYELTFKDPYDGCYERPEYYLVEVYKAGKAHNCLVVAHRDLIKEINTPDDPQARSNSVDYRIWLRENDIKLPNIVLYSKHSYFSRHRGGAWYSIARFINPKELNAPKNKFLTEETSEYHKNNLENYPEHKSTMEKWISNSAKFQQQFEIMNKSKKHQNLDLARYILDDNSNKKQENIMKSLKQLNDLFKSGVLSEEEFIKAKKKILN